MDAKRKPAWLRRSRVPKDRKAASDVAPVPVRGYATSRRSALLAFRGWFQTFRTSVITVLDEAPVRGLAGRWLGDAARVRICRRLRVAGGEEILRRL
jgi:hypothetical protein